MCEKCQKLDKQIEQYQRISVVTSDPATLDFLYERLQMLRALKLLRHPDGEEARPNGPTTAGVGEV